jgi:lipopolysaccharide/colanic/teichoic acid biosynthesis glycosyltransferase
MIKPYRFKRLFDFLFAAVMIFLFFWPMFVLILISGCLFGWPGLFIQSRYGPSGRVFRILKIRSIYKKNPSKVTTNALVLQMCARYSVFLRRTKLDELPQFFNVLKGDMSIVGPRPTMEKFVFSSDVIARATSLFRPGITGLASVRFFDENLLMKKNCHVVDYKESVIQNDKMLLNYEYCLSCSFLVDCRIIGVTAWRCLKALVLQ